MSKSRAECLRILGLPSTASDKEIKDAYRKKALELHPDKNPEDREAATKRFQEVQEAYASLVKEDDDDEEIPEWLRIIIITMRERERRRRQVEQFMFGFGGMFNPFAFGVHDHYYDKDDDDEYEYYQDIFGNIYRERRPRRRYNHYHRQSDDFQNHSNNTPSSRPNQYPGSAEANQNSYSGHEEKDSPNPEWLPKQPTQPTTRWVKQKKKKKGKKNKKKRGHKPVRNVKKMKNNCAGQDSDSDEESVSSTIDSMDTYYSNEELEEEDDSDGVSKNTQDSEKTENYETDESGANLKRENKNLPPEKGNEERKKNSREDFVFENESFTKGYGCKINSATEKPVQEKMKVKVEDTGVGENKYNDNTSDPSQGNINVKIENKEENATRTSKNTSQKNFSVEGEYRGTHKIIDESIFKETTNTFRKKETEEEDWSNWRFPNQDVNSTDKKKGAEDATKTTHQGKGGEESKPTNKERNGDQVLNTGNRGKENVPKTNDNGQRREEMTTSTNGGKGGEKVSKSTDKEKAGKVAQSTNGGRAGEEASKPSELGENNVKVPKGTFGCQNGRTRPSNEGFQYESIKKKYAGYIKKHSDPALTERNKKLIDITTQDN